MSVVLRPLSTSELLDRTFFLYRNNFLVFAGIATIPVLALRLGNSWIRAANTPVGRPTAIIVILVVNLPGSGDLARRHCHRCVGSAPVGSAPGEGGDYSLSLRERKAQLIAGDLDFFCGDGGYSILGRSSGCHSCRDASGPVGQGQRPRVSDRKLDSGCGFLRLWLLLVARASVCGSSDRNGKDKAEREHGSQSGAKRRPALADLRDLPAGRDAHMGSHRGVSATCGYNRWIALRTRPNDDERVVVGTPGGGILRWDMPSGAVANDCAYVGVLRRAGT